MVTFKYVLLSTWEFHDKKADSYMHRNFYNWFKDEVRGVYHYYIGANSDDLKLVISPALKKFFMDFCGEKMTADCSQDGKEVRRIYGIELMDDKNFNLETKAKFWARLLVRENIYMRVQVIKRGMEAMPKKEEK